ncbi:MAG: glycosyltransferase family 4 protein [Solirubrobacterales bacterium]|nr:glycosyltransferase family 4 protein [Solirubrobacterales bacterium]
MSSSGTDRPLRVTFLTWRDLAHPQAGGSEVLIDRLAQGCVERGHDVTLMCGGPLARHPYRAHDLGGEFGQYLRAPLAYARHARGADVIVDVENGVPFFSPLWSRAPVVCLVHHVHGPQWRLRFNRAVAAVGWALERRAMPVVYRRAPFIAMSPSTAAALGQIGVPQRSITVMVNGVDIPAQNGHVRSPEPLFVALGRLVAHKRLDLLLRAWERVRPRVGGRLVIAGAGPELARLQATAGPGAEVLGPVSEAEKRRLLSSAWLLVHPAMHEGWGIVVMEAAAHATPTLAFDVAGVRDAVVRDVTGVLVDDEDALVRRWLELAGDGERREQLGQAALARAREFSWAQTVDRFDALVRAAAAPRRSTRRLP